MTGILTVLPKCIVVVQSYYQNENIDQMISFGARGRRKGRKPEEEGKERWGSGAGDLRMIMTKGSLLLRHFFLFTFYFMANIALPRQAQQLGSPVWTREERLDDSGTAADGQRHGPTQVQAKDRDSGQLPCLSAQRRRPGVPSPTSQ